MEKGGKMAKTNTFARYLSNFQQFIHNSQTTCLGRISQRLANNSSLQKRTFTLDSEWLTNLINCESDLGSFFWILIQIPYLWNDENRTQNVTTYNLITSITLANKITLVIKYTLCTWSQGTQCPSRIWHRNGNALQPLWSWKMPHNWPGKGEVHSRLRWTVTIYASKLLSRKGHYT